MNNDAEVIDLCAASMAQARDGHLESAEQILRRAIRLRLDQIKALDNELARIYHIRVSRYATPLRP